MKNSHGRIALGVILILLGLMFLSRSIFILPFSMHILFYWHSILLLAGIIIITAADNKSLGAALIIIGGLFTAARIWDFSVGEIIRDYWPAVLILIGLSLIFRRGTLREKNDSDADDSDIIDIVNIFGGSDRRIVSQNFKGGNITSIFGGGDVDLRSAKLAPGNNTLDIVTIFGGTDITVPPDWNVLVKVTAIFGGFDDKRKIFQDRQTGENQLILKGVVLFGGGDLKS